MSDAKVKQRRLRQWGRERKTTIKSSVRPTTLDIAWAAGFWEGEGATKGCGLPASDGKQYGLNISAAQKDPEVIFRLQRLFGGAVREFPTASPRTGAPSTIHIWNIYGGRARGFAMTIFKFLSERRKAQLRHRIGKNV